MGVIKHVFSNAIADGTNTQIVRPSDWNSSHAYTLQDAVSLGGNTSGTLALISSGLLFLAGGSNVTLSQNGNSVTISSPNAQPPGAYLTTARASTDAIGLNTAGTNVTWTANSSGLSLNAGGYAGTGFTSTTTAGTVVVGTNNTAGLSLGVPNYLTTAALSNHSHGNPQLNLTNLSGTTASNSAGFTLSLSASPAGGGAQTAISGIIASDATYTSGSVYFSGQNNITVGSSTVGASQYVRLSVGPYITTARGSTDAIGLNTAGTNMTWTANSSGLSINAGGYAGTGFTTTTVAGAVVAGTHDTAGLKLAVPAYLTTAQPVGAYLTTARASNDAVGLNTAQTNVTWTVNSSGLSLNAGGYAGTGFTTTTVAGAVIAGTHDTAGLKLAVPAYLTTAQAPGAYLTTARASNDAIGLNTALTANGVAWTVNSSGLSLNVPAFLTTAMASNRGSDFVQATAAFAGTNASGTIASNGISVSVAAPGAAAENNWANLLGANTSGNTTASGSTMGFSGVNLTLSGTNASQIVFSAPATSSLVGAGGITISTVGSTMSISFSGIDRSMFEIIPGERLTQACAVTGASLSKRPIFVPFYLDGNSLQPRTVRFIVSKQAADASLNITMGVGFYSAANSSSLNLAFSTTNAFSLTTSALWSGVRVMDITGFTNATHTLSEGRWVLGLYVSGSNNSTAVMNLNFMGGDPLVNVGFILAGSNSTAASATNSRLFPFWGVWNATTAGFPAAVAASSIAGGGSSVQADIYAALLEITP